MKKILSMVMMVCAIIAFCHVTGYAQSDFVAEIGDSRYTTLNEAVAAVPADGTKTTVKLLEDCSGDGIVVNEGQNIIFDFNGYTYTINGNLVGSSGTLTNGMQLLKGSTVKLYNGTLTSTNAKILVQNYSNLTLHNITLDGTKSDVCLYTLSNNFGKVNVTEATNIFGDENTVAFDIWYGMSEEYDDGISVTFDKNFRGTVKGKVEYGAASRATSNWMEKATLYITNNGMSQLLFDVEFVASSDIDIKDANIKIAGGLFTSEIPKEYCPEGYEPALFGDKYGTCNHEELQDFEIQEATCKQKGYEKISCCFCNYSIINEYPKLEHKFTSFYIYSNPTYFSNGVLISECDYGCGMVEKFIVPDSKLTLGKVAKLTATQTTASVTLKWNKVSGATGYRVYRKVDGEWKKVATLTGTSYKITDLKSGTKYSFAVKAYVKIDGKTVWAPEQTTINTATDPKATTKISATQTTSTITLSWNKVSGATGYRVYKYNPSTKKYEKIKTTTSRSCKVSGLKSGTTYKFRVRAYKKLSDGTILWGNYKTFTTATDPKKTTIKVNSSSKGKATVTWTDVKGETGYQVWYSAKENSGYKKIANYEGNSTKATKSSLTSGKTYYFKVRAYKKTDSGFIYSNWSSVKSVKIK